MTLREFHEKQILEVEAVAGNIGLLQLINLNHDIKASAERALRNSPFLKGVSLRELMDEIERPGSFRGENRLTGK